LESYIQISKINDFIFCPRSIYFHAVYDQFHQKTYHQKPQIVGKIKHGGIDKGEYSTSKRFLQGKEVYSEKMGWPEKLIFTIKNSMLLLNVKLELKKFMMATVINFLLKCIVYKRWDIK